MKRVNAMKTTTKGLFENSQYEPLFREIYVDKVFRKKQYIVYGFIAYFFPVLICYEIKSY